jgi:benzoylformate decarboxylase
VTGKEALMQILQQEGVEYVFGIPGATEVHFMDAFEDHPEVKYVLCLNEAVATAMAEGYARASGRPGVLNLHTGPGLAAAMPMLSNAYHGGVPLIAMVGQQDTRMLVEEPAMSDDILAIAAPFTRWAAQARHPEDIPTLMRRAFRLASHSPTAPVVVSLPTDVLACEFDFAYSPSFPSFSKLRPDIRSIEVAAGLLASARNPAIIVEGGVTRCEALDEVVRFAELVGARVYQPWMADVNYPVHHPLYMGDLDPSDAATPGILQKADVLIVVGARFFQRAIFRPQPIVSARTKVIQIDDDPWEIAKNYPIACGVQGDIKASLRELSDALDAEPSPAARSAVAGRMNEISLEKRAMMEAFEKKARAESDLKPISGTRLMAEIRDAMLPGTRIVDECWSHSAILRQTIPFKESRSYFSTRGGGSIGAGLPVSLGVKLASPDRPVICVTGDGSAMWSIQSLWNASHHALPVTVVVVSNACYRQVRMMKARILGEQDKGRNLGTSLCPPEIDFCQIAGALGIAGQRVTEPDELARALRHAVESGQPYLVDVAVDPSF